MLKPVVVTPHAIAEQMHQNISLLNILMMVYLAGSVFFIIRLFHQILQTALLIHKYGITRYGDIKLVVVDKDYVPFSFLNLVFIQKDLYKNPDFKKIIAHEQTHVRQFHTIDLILVELFLILQWFNPFIWVTRKHLKNIHEYLADQGVLSNGYNALEYQQLLLTQTFGTQFIALSNNFNQSLIKKRFIMMSKEKTKGMSLLKMVFIVPVAVTLSIMFTISFTEAVMANSDMERIQASSHTLNTPLNSEANPQEEPVFTVVEKMPEYKGGDKALTKYLVDNITYPENARKNGVQGTVYVTFIVEKDGKISNTKILKSVDKELDKEALRVVSAMPKWNPGMEKGKAVKVQYNLPISYKLDGGNTEEVKKTETPQRHYDVKKIDK